MEALRNSRPLQVIVLAVILLGGFGIYSALSREDDGSNPAPPAAQSYVDEYGGSLTAIQAILADTRCPVLQQTFDAAKANFDSFGAGTPRGREQLGRMSAADDRMDYLGCG